MLMLLFFPMLSLITVVLSAPYHRSRTESLHSIQQCQNGRVCTNSCYSNGQLTNCNNRNRLKTIVFDPPFGPILPSVHLRLVRIDSDDAILYEDVTIKKEKLTSRGMHIYFNLLTKSTTNIICADWHACSLDSN